METAAFNPNNKSKRTIPPKRGQVKLNIIRAIVKSAGAIASKAGGIGRKRGENGGSLSSTSTTPAIPSGYTSDAQSDA